MATTGIPAKDAVAKVLRDTTALPAFLTGSAVAAETYDLQQSYSDIDLFVPNEGSYFAVVTKLLCSGYRIENDRFERMWDRHVNIGFNKWHTNSMKLIDNATGTEVNVIYKLVEGHQTTQLSQVIESFDFGLLGVGYETKTGTFRDMRGYLFPGLDPNGPLPMIGYRSGTVGKGLMSQFIMQRTPGRYARYIEYGHDLSAGVTCCDRRSAHPLHLSPLPLCDACALGAAGGGCGGGHARDRAARQAARHAGRLAQGHGAGAGAAGRRGGR